MTKKAPSQAADSGTEERQSVAGSYRLLCHLASFKITSSPCTSCRQVKVQVQAGRVTLIYALPVQTKGNLMREEKPSTYCPPHTCRAVILLLLLRPTGLGRLNFHSVTCPKLSQPTLVHTLHDTVITRYSLRVCRA